MPRALLTWIKLKKIKNTVKKKTKQTKSSLRKTANYDKILNESWSQNLCRGFLLLRSYCQWGRGHRVCSHRQSEVLRQSEWRSCMAWVAMKQLASFWWYGHELSEFLVELEEFETGFVGFRLDEAGFCHTCWIWLHWDFRLESSDLLKFKSNTSLIKKKKKTNNVCLLHLRKILGFLFYFFTIIIFWL